MLNKPVQIVLSCSSTARTCRSSGSRPRFGNTKATRRRAPTSTFGCSGARGSGAGASSWNLYSARQSCLVGDIVEGEQGDEVWGARYEIDRELLVRSDGRRSVLDRIEGHRTEIDPENYRPITVTVELDGESNYAQTYVGDDDARRRCSSDHSDAKPARTTCTRSWTEPTPLGSLKATCGPSRSPSKPRSWPATIPPPTGVRQSDERS